MKKSGIFIIGLVLIGALTAACVRRCPVSGTVTVEGLEANLRGKTVYVRVEEGCWHVEGDGLWEMLDLEKTNGQPAGEVGMVLQLAECYLLEFYPGGQAVAYDGYASSTEQNYQTYQVPEETEELLTAWVLENGTQLRDSAASFRR